MADVTPDWVFVTWRHTNQSGRTASVEGFRTKAEAKSYQTAMLADHESMPCFHCWVIDGRPGAEKYRDRRGNNAHIVTRIRTETEIINYMMGRTN